MSTEENKRIVLRFLDEGRNKGNPAIVDELISYDYVLHGSGTPAGPNGAKMIILMSRVVFPDAVTIFEDVIAEGDKVVVRWTTSATHRGEFMGIAPTGKRVSYMGMDIFRVVGGKIRERWGVTDNLGMIQQLEPTEN